MVPSPVGRHLFAIVLRGGGPYHYRECPTEQLRLAIFSGLGFAVAQAPLGVMRLQVLSAGGTINEKRQTPLARP
jgi:hypothetical protein